MTHFHPGQLVLGVVVALLAGVIAFVFMTLAYKLTLYIVYGHTLVVSQTDSPTNLFLRLKRLMDQPIFSKNKN